ncbi:MAG: class II aldolase/adducin family protein [Betaproteobacteria bacterium AqS2]|uniref:L-ribulose-5-phosphate 4-epimerase n=1 Tax=Candidatus Amphirhobacter heronislandensis TaxID=1732024 RepID=A0A930XYN3_9GAMM|nr:class II aldolase/adducin family protein [Betaproteobacteria bacterium AqS2]
MSAKPDPAELKQAMERVAAAARRAFGLGLQSNAGGNLSLRLRSAEAIVIKPSGVGFAECGPANLQLVHLDGRVEPSEHKPSKDLGFHLEIYRRRPDVGGIVHCHSPWATGYASAGIEIPCLTVQTVEKIGRIPLIPLAAGVGAQTEEEIGPVFADPAVRGAVLANHGSVGVGPDIEAAGHIAEIIEETAHIAFVRDALLAANSLPAPPAPQLGTPAESRRRKQEEKKKGG